ncbi:cytochrome P450 3a7 [Biomphalaria pfeifferi]|uniref:Cytochrome P450 3a7 n=1 Tax=Biomphalaria pfeifferi TaxID=112525 RepID=A0AAD8C9E9_BIOPF|nr:cytochrome P450 3a7 [Biomphalaria pfeifferi]
MELWTVLLILLLSLVMLVYVGVRLLTYNHDLFKKLAIDSPPTSIFGHFHVGVKFGVFQTQVEMYSQYKYKKVFGWFNFTIPAIVVCDLDLVKAVAVVHFNKFVNRSATIEYEPPFRDILLNLKGEHWKRVRSIVSPTFTSGRIKKMATHVERNVKNLLEYLRQKQESGEEIELKETSGQFALDVIASIAFGLKVDSLKDPKNKFAVEAGKVVKPNLLLVPLFLLFPRLRGLFSRLGLSIMAKKPMAYLVETLDAAIEERKRDGTEGHINDFLDLMMIAEKENDTKEREPLTRSEIHAQSLIFIFAGLESMSTVMSFTLFLLAAHPDCRQRAQDELDEILGDQTPDYETVQGLHYLEMCINEAMRMVPPGFVLDRKCVESTDIDGVHFPKDMIVMIPVYAIHHDPDLWPDPHTFMPERFTEENKRSRHPYAFLPFGQGPRNCIGMRLAMLELKLTLATILQHFTPVTSAKTVYPFKLYKFIPRAVDGTWVKIVARK